MLSTALNFLLNTIFNLLTLLFLLRFFLQLFKAPFNNPLTYMVVSLTDFAVNPARRIIPSWGKVDLSTLVLALVTQFLLQLCLLWLRDLPVSLVGNAIWTSLIGMSLLGIFRTMLDVFFYAILLQVILSWVNPHSPISSVLDSLTKPILAPIQRLLPTAGGMDFSPVVALILIQMVNISVVKTLELQLLNLY
ncbi:MAG TPA: YggT family protein [Methylotenera sp.]|nr:YggT family protein [Methylotenera sp.]